MTAVVRASRRARSESGAAAVEFALIAPVLFLLVFGIINFGYLFGQKLSLNQAAREGARLAVVPGSTGTAGSAVDSTDKIEAIVNQSSGLIPSGDIDVTLHDQADWDPDNPSSSEVDAGCGSLVFGEQLRVEATYTATPLIRLPFVPASLDMSSAGIFRCEWGPGE